MTSGRNVEFSDMQGLVRYGHGHLSDASYILLDVADAAEARNWLGTVPISTAEPANPPETALQVAFTADGLRAMEIEEAVIDGFSDEFIVGMASATSRSRRLGDIGENAPKHWQWGGASKPVPHLLIMIYARNGQLKSWRAEIQNASFKQAFRIRIELPTNDIGIIEPFGFVDGISQPTIDWERKLSTDLHERDRYSNLLSIGEILLGYPNEYGQYTSRPLVDQKYDNRTHTLPVAEEDPSLCDFGRNGSYLVIRQLHQDVPGFWQFINQKAGGAAEERERLAAAMVGRYLDGTPLITNGNRPTQGIDERSSNAALNQFDYDNDPHGHQCPIGAHIRRSNPRTGDFPPGVKGPVSRLIRTLGFGRRHPGDDLIASTRFHRILRRGREYGPHLSPEEAIKPDAPETERGLHFICLVANISRQFEFVQNAWSLGTKFGGVQNETDPLLGNRQSLINGESTDHFTEPDTHGPARSTHELPQFITVRGGGYFFMPGIRALQYIATPPQSANRAEQ